ncbi:asparagine synthase [Cokeromyces recurvatus]|uniref:asparagine synthase n=1 Tax=Cokeromyces recurvatus TaxID=90255 RepID=UPI00222085FD|nr:asparagine synthase [Cokeromyces recurvatus]KAI7903754.1 asparagine synthase [Cokeromyces recurvatus]
MCGFCCYFHFDNSESVYPNLDLDSALEYIHHRGPDSRGKYISPDGRCALGHVRLSIIDLAGGHQPLSNQSGDIQSVVNGELYDFERIRSELEAAGHKFKTLSDSEIALHLFEEHDLSFLEYLRGEFALCIWDSKKDRFIAARDRYGIKPLYYTICNGTLLVASEIKSFIPMGWKPEWDVDSIVSNGYTFDHRTCFKGVYKVPPAHYLIANSTGYLEVRPYWDADYPDKNLKETRTVDEMIQGVREHLIEAVRHRLRADVPLGVYLSGGIDSSCIAGIASALLREKNPDAKLKAFSISFAESEKYDESEIAERTAKFCNADFQKLSLTEDDLLTHFEDSVWHVEQPQFNLNGVGKFLLSAFVRDQGYKVVLTGEGSDEHFAGYAFFHADYLREPDLASPNGFGTLDDKQRLTRLNLFGKQAEFSKYSDKGITDDLLVDKMDRTRRMVNNVNTHTLLCKHLSLKEEYFNRPVLSQYGAPNPALTMAESINGIARYKANHKWHPLHTALYLENRTMLPNYLCNHLGDRSEMAHSIEARTPFLDHHFCEYVNHLPPSVKIKAESDGALNEKWILKEAVKPYITDEIYNRTKQPYLAPSSKGRNPLTTDLVNKLITKENLDHLGWVNTESVYEAKERYLETNDPELFKDMLFIMSFVILSQRFQVATYHTMSQATVAR